jgi:hypothetical protein
MSAGRRVNSLSQHWGTPPKYIKAITKFFGGHISLDPCSNEYSLVKASHKFLLPKNDGLIEKWDYPTIFVNPPYGNDKVRKTTIKNWLAKCTHAHYEFGSEVLALVPIATNTRHWKEYVFTQAYAICFLYDTRLKFLENGKEGGKGAPMACAMIYWGKNYKRFYDIFINYGAVIDISNLIGEQIGDERKHSKIFNTSSQV